MWLHNRFLQAGSDLFLTDTFGSNGFRLKRHNSQDRTQVLNIAVAKLARRAVDAYSSATGKKAIVAGSIGTTSELFQPLGQLSHAGAPAGFKE